MRYYGVACPSEFPAEVGQMRYLVFPHDSQSPTKYGIKINVDAVQDGNYGMSIVVRERTKRARIYREGCFDEYEIESIIDLGSDRYYILGKLLAHQKPDYLEPAVNNQALEVEYGNNC